MKKSIVFIVEAIALLMLFPACSDSPSKVIKERRDLSDFSAVIVHDGWDVFLQQGETYSVEVRTNKNIMDQAITKIEGNALHIYSDRSAAIASNHDIERTVLVTLPVIERIEVSEGADVFLKGKFKVTDLALKLSSGSTVTSKDFEVKRLSVRQSGGSELKITFRSFTEFIHLIMDGGAEATLNKVDAAAFKLRADGASIVNAVGLVKQSDVVLKGAGKFFAFSLKSGKMNLKLDGASSAEIFVTDSLDYKLSHASRLLKKGRAAVGLQEFDRTSRVDEK